MSELEKNRHRVFGDKPGRAKRISTRIDMTPMVDLAFLLVTFFMLTTSLTKPRAMEVVMPAGPASTSIGVSEAITILIDSDESLWYAFGNDDLKAVNLQTGGLRKLLIAHQDRVKEWQKSKAHPMKGAYVLIKPDDHANYQSVIDVLDEVKIAGIANYCLLEPSENEMNQLKN